MIKVVWSAQARREWAEHYRYYFARNPDAARRMRRAVMDGAKRLAAYPRIGKPGRIEGSRELVITGTPFLIVYDEHPAQVEILHVNHGRQNYPSQGGNDP